MSSALSGNVRPLHGASGISLAPFGHALALHGNDPRLCYRRGGRGQSHPGGNRDLWPSAVLKREARAWTPLRKWRLVVRGSIGYGGSGQDEAAKKGGTERGPCGRIASAAGAKGGCAAHFALAQAEKSDETGGWDHPDCRCGICDGTPRFFGHDVAGCVLFDSHHHVGRILYRTAVPFIETRRLVRG